mgnify:CR=1 FL=1
MSKDIHTNRIIRLKEQSRQIIKEILEFGVAESQKLDIIHMLSMTLENNEAMKDISKILKKYMTTINKEDDDANNVIENKNKIILS